MNEQHFIMTSDENTAKTLRELGYQELPKNGNKWVFVNNHSAVFSQDNMKVNYTNILTF